MKQIAMEPLGESALVTTGAPLIGGLVAKDLRVLMSCGGKGLCSTCHVRVCAGMDQLSPVGPRERRTLALVADATPDSRLACQAAVHGDGVVVRVPEGMYIERAEDLLALLGTRSPANVLHPLTGAVLVPKGKMITRTLLERSRGLEHEVRRVRAGDPVTGSGPVARPEPRPAFTASGEPRRPSQSGSAQRLTQALGDTQSNAWAGPTVKARVPRPGSPGPEAVPPVTPPPARALDGGSVTGGAASGPGTSTRTVSRIDRPGDDTAPPGPDEPRAAEVVRPGAQVDKYLLLECVGKGGAGVVYRALHTTLKTLVAVKFLRPDLGSAGPSARGRMAREAQLLAQLNHPNVVRVLDFEDHPTRPYLVMEFVEGFTAADLIEQSQRVSPVRALEIVMDVAAGLEAAWKLGIIHRDVKPANVLVTRNAGSKLVDLELAAFARSDFGGEAPDGTVGCGAGTVGYMSPEAIGRAAVDHRSDIYSLGATLFHLAAGRLPFIGDSQYEIIFKQIEEAPPVLHEFVPEASPRLSAAIQTMMAKSPTARYQTYAELRTELEAVLLTLAWRGSLASC